MLFNKYTLANKEFLLYGEEFEPKPEETFGMKLVESDVKLKDNINIPVYSYDDLFAKIFTKSRTRDSRLEDVGICTFENLSAMYELVRLHKAPFSKSIRDLAVEKYIELNNCI